MKSPTMASLMQTKVRHALGVMLAISAIFAVVISTISMPGDRATAQVADADAEVEKRAEAWWDSLTAQERTNAFWGKGFDNDDTATGTQLPAQTSSSYDSLPATDANGSESGEFSFVPGSPGFISQEYVKEVVDGKSDDSASFTGDIYAVGEQEVNNGQAIRGFQSVELWWDHLTCTEARIAVGEDNDDLSDLDADDATTGFQIEASDVCTATVNSGNNGIVDGSKVAKAYSGLGDAKAQVDEVGQAILGLSSAGSASSADNARAKRWWDSLDGTRRVQALYGDGVSPVLTPPDRPTSGDTVTAARLYLATRKYDEITAGISYPAAGDDAAKTFTLDTASATLATGVKELVNDRAILIYGSGGSGGKYEGVDAWWDSIGCLENQISVGEDNEPVSSTPGEFCRPFSGATGLVDDQDRNNDPGNVGTLIDDRRVSDRERAMTVGRALLNLADIPDVAAWWDTLSADQMVNVVYGDPAKTAREDVSSTPDVDESDATDTEKALFKKKYAALSGAVLNSVLPSATTRALLTRHGVTAGYDLNDNGAANDTLSDLSEVTLGFDLNGDGDATDTDVDDVDEGNFRGLKAIVDAIATDIFDPPHTLPGAFRRTTNEIVDKDDEPITDNVTNNQPADDDEFDPPYQSVGDWWETLDCRLMRLAVGEDNDYPAVDTDTNIIGFQNETSIYCGHLPGAAKATNAANTLSQDAHDRVDVVGKALLARSEVGRPSFNVAVTGIPTITGTAKVGSMLTTNTGAIADGDGVGAFSYQWIRDGADISGATGSTYTLTAADANAMISVRVSFTDGERYPESTTSVGTSVVSGSLGRISKIEPAIRDIKLSGGGTVVLSLNVYGMQGDIDNSLVGAYSWSVNGTSIEGSGRELSYTAPSSPGTYNVKATLADGDCRPKDETNRVSACSAEFEVKVLRPSAPQPAPEAPVNPPGDIPSILADSEGNQYEVFTPVEGGTFSGAGYSITAASGAVPNGEFIGVRMSDDGAASNAGMTHQRYTLGGNMYGVHAVDSSSNAITSTELDDPATVCVPLPDELRSNISDLAVVAINSDGSLTILSARVRITTAGTMVCAGLSSLPASLAVGSAGAPAAIPTPTPEPTPEPPATGGSAPASSATVLWALLLGIAVLTLGSVLVIARRREGTRKS